MSGWAIVAIIAIVVWGIVQTAKAKAGIISDEDGNETYIGTSDAATKAEAEAMRAEMQQLRERLQVLERIATDNNSLDARERARISAEIEALRGTDTPVSDSGIPLTTAPQEKEQSQ
ncbi:hypothetical protein [Erythrobacter sp. SCSIO 43205]|uniref:hypothetical protein n=1 Tax=Erythrobacter sp. SCSIO 43205 TaxID=2779361 RepID=UPI00210258FA|nr:hypothetical protein [Erythrobacter sp. SCSIO 43205]